jgi:hypothetical protein
MYKIINLTPEKNATRSVGEYVSHVLGGSTNTSYYVKSYNVLSESDWLNFDNIVNESIVFMFVRNPYNRLVSSFIHTCLSLDYVLDFPEWYFDLPINKENQLKCFKNFCMTLAESGGHDDPHLSLQLDVIDNYVKMIGSKFGKPTGKFDNFSIIPYIENKKIFIGKIENIKEDISKLVLRFDDTVLVNIKTAPEWIGDNSEIKFSNDYKDWYNDELYDLMTPLFKKELEVLNYGF